jgi:protoheme IX farnesyltransferase
MLKEYYRLAKPGIIYGNLFTTVAAFLFATKWSLSTVGPVEHAAVLFIATAVGISFVIGSGCVFNNYLDRDIDRKMERTRERALVTGKISVRNALIYSLVLLALGAVLLYMFVNLLTLMIALWGWVAYVILYGYAKRLGWWGVLVGSIPGAVPIVVGYTAVTHTFDATALVLFLILVVWQMPHFYGIAIYRLDEYVAAGIPVLPAVKGVRIAKLDIIAYIIAFILSTSTLFIIKAAGYVYLVVMLVVSVVWLWKALKGLKISDKEMERKWAKKVFLFSLIVLTTFSIVLAVSPLLP